MYYARPFQFYTDEKMKTYRTDIKYKNLIVEFRDGKEDEMFIIIKDKDTEEIICIGEMLSLVKKGNNTPLFTQYVFQIRPNLERKRKRLDFNLTLSIT